MMDCCCLSAPQGGGGGRNVPCSSPHYHRVHSNCCHSAVTVVCGVMLALAVVVCVEVCVTTARDKVCKARNNSKPPATLEWK